MSRLFIAVWPTDDVCAELTALHRKDQVGVRFVRPENWHITLRFLGDADPNAASDALDGLAMAEPGLALGDPGLEPVTAHLGPAVDVMADRALVVPVAGLDRLAEQVVQQTATIGSPPGKRFFGHLTLARVKSHVAMPRVLGAPFSAQFEVDEIALVQSRLDADGARYETLQTWPVG